MELGNELLKQTLTKQYSKLSFISEIALIDKLKSDEWWAKEKYRLKIQHVVSLIGSWFLILIFLTVILISFYKGNSTKFFYVPLISFALIGSGLLSIMMALLKIEAKIRQFELLQILFDKK